ncbi:hypothetical protein HUS23_05505 [Ectothiorhodospiraceae bacterium 2226]|nr:hypothetical protein HUS23_05505 [Ectothiorhodospiraceae bacterium 2226]
MTDSSSHVVTARSARSAAALFNYGNIVAALVPFPLGIFWLGGSMLVYAMNRHNPNPKVGYYTQIAAYRLYGVAGFIVVVAAFFGTDPTYWLITWAVAAAILIPWSVYDLYRIRQDHWTDVAMHLDGDEQ